MKLSIIIPVYRGALYIVKMLDSIYSQGLAMDEFEVICVDDCSPDDSVEVIRQYQTEHSNLRIICHEQNKRLASSCATGLRNAQGDYVWILDQDDWLETNVAPSLLNHAISNNLDLLLFNYQRVTSDGKVLSRSVAFPDCPTMIGVQFIQTYFSDNFDQYLLGYRWRAFFRREFLRENNISFHEGMTYDDTIILLRSIICSRKMSSVNTCVVNYRVNQDSITYSKGMRGDMIYEFSMLVGKEVRDYALELIESEPMIANVLLNRSRIYFNNFVLNLCRTGFAERRNFYGKVKENGVSIYKQYRCFDQLSRVLLVPCVGPWVAECLSLFYSMKHS